MTKTECNCEFCEKCPNCGHRADEHMAGDFNAGICFICQKYGVMHCSDMHKQTPEADMQLNNNGTITTR